MELRLQCNSFLNNEKKIRQSFQIKLEKDIDVIQFLPFSNHCLALNFMLSESLIYSKLLTRCF